MWGILLENQDLSGFGHLSQNLYAGKSGFPETLSSSKMFMSPLGSSQQNSFLYVLK